MRFQNTSRCNTAEARALVEFGMHGVNTAGVAVHLKNRRRGAYSGRAYRGVPSCSPRAKQVTVEYLITLHIGPDDAFPVVNYYSSRLKRVPRLELQDWREALVKVAAHEARHIHQFRNGKRISEVDCEKFAAKRLEEYRRQRAEQP